MYSLTLAFINMNTEKTVIKTRNNLSENLQGNKYYKGYSTLDTYFK